MEIRGLVMSIEKRRATVMLPGGEFCTISTRGQTVLLGQEIWIPKHHRRGLRWFAIPALVAVGVFTLAQTIEAPITPMASAVVSIDINPSINLDISHYNTVIGVEGLDPDGSLLLRQKPVMGMQVNMAVEDLVRQALDDGYFAKQATDLVIGGVFAATPPEWFSHMAQTASTVLRARHLVTRVVSISGVSPSLVKAMQHSEMSVGRYLLWQRTPIAVRNRWSVKELRQMPVVNLVVPAEAAIQKPRRSRFPPGIHKPTPTSTSKPAPGRGGILPNLSVSEPALVVQPPLLPMNPGKVPHQSHPPRNHGKGQGLSSPPSAPPIFTPPSHAL